MADGYANAYNYTGLCSYEREFDSNVSTKWMKSNWIHSFTLSVVYAVFLCYIGERIMSRRKAMILERPLLIWNCFLAVCSIVAFIRMSPEFLYSLYLYGFKWSICDPSCYYGVTGFWAYVFALSKAVELIDTVFIVLRKRPLTFLHVYHHITVLTYTWHAYKDRTASGRWFGWINCGVHSVMYTYYACRSAGIRFNKWLPMTLTSLQLAQMVVGCYIAIIVYLTKLEDESCNQTFENLYFSFFIYTTYLVLFASFFYKTYIRKGNRYHKPEENGVKKVE
jgi:hypothetical protein